MSYASIEAPPPLPTSEPRPWGFWMTTMFTVAIYGIYIVIQIVVGVVMAVVWAVRHEGADPGAYAEDLMNNGLFVAAATLIAGPVCILLTLVLAYFRKGITLRDYFALKRPPILQCVGWTVLTVAVLFAMDFIRISLGEPLVPEIVVAWYETAHFLPVLVLAIVVVAPVMEELVARGFMYRGLAASRVGVAGAIVLTSLFWAALHFGQYNLLNTGMIFVFGLILGGARATSGSLYLPLFLHALNNGISTFQIAYFIGQNG